MTVRDICKQKDKLLSFAASAKLLSAMKKRKAMKLSTYEHLDTAPFEWIAQLRNEGTPIPDPILASKSEHFHKLLGIEGTFNAFYGWLTRFKQRHGIREIALQGVKLSSDTEAAEIFKAEFEESISSRNVCPNECFFWKCLPTRTLAFESEHQAPGHESSKERYTILCCGNASENYKFDLVVIG